MVGLRILSKFPFFFLTALLFIASACATSAPPSEPLPQDTATPSKSTPTATSAAARAQVALDAPTPQPGAGRAESPDDWKSLPITPTVSEEMKDIYQRGLEAGNDPHAFSVLGDCQSLPDVFMGPYDSDPRALAELTSALRETVRNFSGSFDRYSPTVKDGTTTGALLWGEWNDNEEGWCEPGETPLDCELRVHKPSIVIIHIGTHWETRNYRYLGMIVEKIIAHGAVPVLVTKADNRELDERVNEDVAALAAELGLPLWNFWAVMQDQPNNGLVADSAWELTEDAQQIHRRAALEMLDAVWRALQ